jgi:tetratricopeptide (TPR) repeat protein
MRAFLSHSSKDKGFVEQVAELLKPGTFELDSTTFDAGLLNSQVITEALKRSDLFCLFLSADSVQSAYVVFETLLGMEFFARGEISRFLVICIDEDAFQKASGNVMLFSIVRRVPSVEAAAWRIQGTLVSAASGDVHLFHPFIGREDSLKELEAQVINPERPAQKALYVSGNFGTGRRTLVRKFFQNQYPQVGNAFPTVKVEEFDGPEEIYRKAIAAIRPTTTARELVTRLSAFGAADANEKARQIALLFNSLVTFRESGFLLDVGGILDDGGAFYPEIDAIIDHLENRPHPPVSIISPRMVPLKERRESKDIAYCAVKSLTRDDAVRLAQRLLRDKGVSATEAQISEIVDLSDRHPYNFYRIVEEIGDRGVSNFLVSPKDFVDWKHRQSSEYLERQEFADIELTLLGLLKVLPALDFAAIVDALGVNSNEAADALLRLSHLHVVEHSGDEYSVSPPIRTAVERDKRINIPEQKKRDALAKLAESLAVRLDEGTAPIALVDSAVISAIQSGKETYATVFLLPSHHVWLAKRHYDQKHYQESIRLAKEALKSNGRLSRPAMVAACRFMCLSAARLGDSATFDLGIQRLVNAAGDKWSKSNIAFLKGFNERMRGHQPAAEKYFREAYELSPGNYSSARELAAICLARGNLSGAEQFAREAHGTSSSNAYVLDILIAVLTRKHGRKVKENAEIRDLMDVLKRVGDEGGRSFYTTRKAEIELVGGDRRLARVLAEEAISRTQNIFEPRRIYAEVLLAERNFAKIPEILQWMREKVNAPEPGERRSNYRAYLETNAHYLTEVGQFSAAKEIYDDVTVFTPAEREQAIREIELLQMAKSR